MMAQRVRLSLTKVDYIRITGILELNSSPDSTDVTFNIEHSADEEFSKSKTGIITLRLSELMDIVGFQNNDIEIIASQLIEQVFIRQRDQERTIRILHQEGLPLKEWLIDNTPLLKQ